MNFFTPLKALNPLSTESQCFDTDGDEIIIDQLPHTVIAEAWNANLGFINSVKATYLIIVGHHDPFNANTDRTSKGVLDLFILPLLARKVLNTAHIHQSDKDEMLKTAGLWTARALVAPITLARMLIGAALTLALSPIVALVVLARKIVSLACDLVKWACSCCFKDSAKNAETGTDSNIKKSVIHMGNGEKNEDEFTQESRPGITMGR